MQLNSKIKNVANDVVHTIPIHSLLVNKQHLELTISREFLIEFTKESS